MTPADPFVYRNDLTPLIQTGFLFKTRLANSSVLSSWGSDAKNYLHENKPRLICFRITFKLNISFLEIYSKMKVCKREEMSKN